MRRTVIVLSLLVLSASASYAGVSDGNYHHSRQKCSGNAQDADREDYVEPECNTVMFTIADGTGHEYVAVGVPQTADGTNANAIRFCFDLGSGTKYCGGMSQSGPSAPTTAAGTAAHPETGLHLYFGADDNLNTGEHDGSEWVKNGPSDGGAIQLNVSPDAFMQWLAALQSADLPYLLTHLIPGADGGMGACADGVCIAIQTQRRVAFQGTNRDKTKHRDVANYDGKVWDPETCAGPSDSVKDCGGRTMGQWVADEGTVYVEPGVQIFEDPDPQGSPIGMYPLPALYLGSCGVVFGGGDMSFPDSAITNAAGQLFLTTGCG